MGIKKFRPTTPSRRFITGSDFSEVTSKRPEKSLIAKQSKNGGRNNNGRITARHRGGGHKRRYRIIDFKRDKLNVPGKVDSIQYDPNRTAFIALITYEDGEQSYILAPQRLAAGDKVISSTKA